MQVMKPIPSEKLPIGPEWLYEIKYDGFRCLLIWEKDKVELYSKRGLQLTSKFPEIIDFCQQQQSTVESFLPITIDGELVVLNHPYQANFSWIQTRGRLQNEGKIHQAASTRPATYIAFDLLETNGQTTNELPLVERKSILQKKLKNITTERFQFITTHQDLTAVWKIVFDHKAEGIVAKRKQSRYTPGKGHGDWYKQKNWRPLKGILTAFDTSNDYFQIDVLADNIPHTIGSCKHGLDQQEAAAIQELFREKGNRQGSSYHLPPAISANIHALDLLQGKLREPNFVQLTPHESVDQCTAKQLQLDMAMLPSEVTFTNLDKMYWPEPIITKGEMICYLREIAPYMLPFLRNRTLTMIRLPNGVSEEHFFQKHLPDHAPDFIQLEQQTAEHIRCASLAALLWFANQGAMEYHIPFQYIDSNVPVEIVFDLDPPSRDQFDLAIEAALLIKELLDHLNLHSFVKTSGNKGIQIYIPIPENSFTYEDTALFTQAVALTVEQQRSDLFTTERMKSKRQGRLYIDYVQHGRDKTIIAPYSPRKTAEATVAAPLFWQEVKLGLQPTQFTISNMIERVQYHGCPFQSYAATRQMQNLEPMKALIRQKN